MARKHYVEIDLCTYSILQESNVIDYYTKNRHMYVYIVCFGPTIFGTGE